MGEDVKGEFGTSEVVRPANLASLDVTREIYVPPRLSAPVSPIMSSLESINTNVLEVRENSDENFWQQYFAVLIFYTLFTPPADRPKHLTRQ